MDDDLRDISMPKFVVLSEGKSWPLVAKLKLMDSRNITKMPKAKKVELPSCFRKKGDYVLENNKPKPAQKRI